MLEARERTLIFDHGARWVSELGLDPAHVSATPRPNWLEGPRGGAVVLRRGFLQIGRTSSSPTPRAWGVRRCGS